MECPKCQADNREGARFCGKCQTKLSLICPQCKSENPPENAFCDQCGFDLKEPKESTPIDYQEPQSYTPKHLADKILNTRSAIEGERKLVTVLFADVANYTSLSEKLDPEEVHQIMDGCFKVLMDEIHRYEGTINQFTGDGVMALFGAPVALEDHAQGACYASLAIQNGIHEYGEKLKQDYGVDFRMRIGLNSGPVIVGAIGDDLRMDYTAVGDTTNLAARMESMAEPGATLVSNNTYKSAQNYFDFESLGMVEVKGKAASQEVYRLLKTGKAESRMDVSVAKGLTRFVGRQGELYALIEGFEKAKTGSGQVVGIVGEAGVGKSRTLLEFRNDLPEGEYRYLEGRCLHYGGSMPYLPLLDILRSFFEIKEGDREVIIKNKIKKEILKLDTNLEYALSPFQDLLSIKVEDETYVKLEPLQKREKIFEALRDLLIRVSHKNPLIIAIEDLHWMDKTSEAFLDYLIGWLPNTRILLVLLYRPEYTHQWGSKSYYSKIGVDQLSLQTSAELVKSILENAEIVPELRELILQKTAGNPLFMEEFTHSLIENGTIQRKNDQYVLSRKISDIQIPDTIEGIIAARLDRLDDNLKRTMQVASVIGRDFAFRILQTITGMREELKSHLMNLQDLEFIYEKQLFPELEYIFKHILTQEVAYNSLLHKRRKEIHGKIGEAIEEIYVERLEEFYEMLAYHYSKSENLEKACQYLKLSGNKAVSKHSPWEAFRFYKETLEVIKQLPITDQNKKAFISVCRLMHIPMIILGYPEGSFDICQEGEKLSKEIGDMRNRAHLLCDLGFYNFKIGNPSEAVKLGEKALIEAEKTKDVETIASVTTDLSCYYFWVGNFNKIIEVAPNVINLLKEAGKEYEIFPGRTIHVPTALNAFYGSSLALIGEFNKGKAICEEAFQIACKVNHIRSKAQAKFHLGRFFLLLGDGKQASQHFQESIRYCEEAKYILLLGYALTGFGHAVCLLDDLETALDYMDKGLKLQLKLKIQLNISLFYWPLSVVFYHLENWQEALKYINEALKSSRNNQELHLEGIANMWKGRILGKTEKKQSEKAEEHILQGINLLKELNLKPYYSESYLYLGELYADMGRKDEAIKYLNDAENNFKEMGMDYWLAKTREVLGRL
ncbi:guanylate cyclase [Desulfobacteraceae bacterium SEEP-SAG9]|nr:guanylate cyclase [Desulfobacteraceae bacterium SEEP-SAG9]